MPKGTPVERCYKKLKKKMGQVKAIKICQKSTKMSLSSGRPIKTKKAKTK